MSRPLWSVASLEPVENGLFRTLQLARIVERIVKAAALAALLGGLHDQLGADREVAKLERVGCDEIAEVVVVDLATERLDAMRRAREALVRADDADVVPHEAPDLVPHVRDEHRFVRRHGVADLPVGDVRSRSQVQVYSGALFFPAKAIGMRPEACGREAGADERLHQRVRGEAVRAVKAGRRAFADGGKPLDRRATVRRRLDAAAGVVCGRDDRNEVLRHVDAELHALVVDVRKAVPQIGAALLADVEAAVGVARALHLAVDRPRDDVAGRERAARVVVLHERAPLAVHEHRALAADRLADEEALRLRMVEARRVELDELHVLDLRAGAPREGDAVARRDVGVAGVEVDLAAAARRQHGVGRTDRVDLVRLLVEHVGADAAVRPLHADALRDDEVDDDRVLVRLDLGVAAQGAEHRGLALLARDVARVEDAPRRMAALAAEFPGAVLLLREAHAAVDQVLDRRGALGDDAAHDGLVAQARAGDLRVGDMGLEGVRGVGHAADAALREVRVAVLEPLLGHQDRPPGRRQVECRHEPAHTRADDEVVAVYDAHVLCSFGRLLYHTRWLTGTECFARISGNV